MDIAMGGGRHRVPISRSFIPGIDRFTFLLIRSGVEAIESRQGTRSREPLLFCQFSLAGVGLFSHCNRLLNNFQWPDRVWI
jgi:hypothetical protein